MMLTHSIHRFLPAALALSMPMAGATALAHEEPRAVQLIPREVFFGDPERAGVTLSPDGKYLAYLAPFEGVLNVWVQKVGVKDATAVTRSKERPVFRYVWAENSEQGIYSQDRGGDENFRLYAVNLDGGGEIELTPFDNIQARITGQDKNFPDEILIGINNRVPQLHDVWRIHTRTGERELVYENNEGWVGFISDSQFNLRIAQRFNQKGGMDAFIRKPGEAEWISLASWDMEDTMTSGFAGFTRDGRTLYMLDSRGENTGGLYEVAIEPDADLTQIEPKLIFRSNLADVAGAIGDPHTGKVQAVSFEYARREWRILDESIRKDWEYLRTVSRGDFSIGTRTNDDRKWIVTYLVDDGPVRYYLYDRDAGEAEFLFTNRPALEGLPLVRMEPVVIEARDGLRLVSYLSLPYDQQDVKGRVNRDLPMVLLVHGGPWARDAWGYDGYHQWLANRGYAVLSVNFRGSTGFGKDFVNAGNREWAGKMHDDLIDAVNWAIDYGIADPDRIAIMGGSYGGYATLVGLTFTPDVFAAGVDIVGPSHVRTLLETIPPYWEPIKVMFETRVGALDDPEYLDSISPLTHVDRIKRPLLIGQGANDPRVKESESEQIVAEMQEKGIPVTYVVFPDEGHGFARAINRLAFNAVTEAFLAQHLGGRYEPLGNEIGESTAKVPEGAGLIPGLADTLE